MSADSIEKIAEYAIAAGAVADDGDEIGLGNVFRIIAQRLRALPSLADAGPTFTTGHCANHRAPGGCQLHNLQCGYPDCDRKPACAKEAQR